MAEQLWGAGTGLVVVLAYVLLVECLTAAAVLLCEFIVLRVRALRTLVGIAWSPQVPERLAVVEDQEPAYRVGGGIMRWD